MQKNRILDGFLPSDANPHLVLLTGARQTGKTTLAKSKYPHLRYYNLDAPENREAIRNIQTSLWSRDVGNAIIDEAQKEPAVFEKIKYAFDEKSISFEVILGSSQILLLKKIRESLAGRVSIYELWPLMMCELYGSKEPLINKLLAKDSLDNILSAVPGVLLDRAEALCLDSEKYILAWGGMPALLELSDDERWKWLKDYTYTYLERDLIDLVRLDDLEPFKKFQRLSALRSAKLLNYSELARDAAVSVDTARRYLEYLRLSYQVILLPPYSKNITSTVVKSPKLYWIDVGILRQLSGFRSEVSGEVYETMVVSELMKWIKTTQKEVNLYFYRTRSGLEVDLILETETGVYGIEIKSRDNCSLSDARGLLEIADKLGSQWRGGLVLYRGKEIKKMGNPSIWAVPSRRMFT